MATIKRRGKRVGPKQRIYITLALPTIEALRAQGEKLGYSVSALAEQVIDRGVAAGLLDADTPSPQGAVVVRGALLEQYYQLVEELQRSHEKRIEGLTEHLAIKDRLIAQMKRGLDDYTEIITEQAADLQFFERERSAKEQPFGVTDVRPGRAPGTTGAR